MSSPTRRPSLAAAVSAAVVAVAAAAIAIAVVMVTSSSAAPTRLTAFPATIQARHTRIGAILVDSAGDTLYAYSSDRRNHDSCALVKGCLTTWPVVSAQGGLHAGPGVRASLLSTIVVGGQRQVTYAGHPLYTWVDNGGPGDVSYVGHVDSGGSWPAVTPTGTLVN